MLQQKAIYQWELHSKGRTLIKIASEKCNWMECLENMSVKIVDENEDYEFLSLFNVDLEFYNKRWILYIV